MRTIADSIEIPILIEGDINMEPTIYFNSESPDYNFGLWGKDERLAANRVVVCTLTEYGLCNDKKMPAIQFSRLIETLQMTTGNIPITKIKRKIKPSKDSYIKRVESSKFKTKPIRTIGTESLTENINGDSPVESIS